MQLSREHHIKQLAGIFGPDQKAAYYKAFIDPTAVNLSTAENILLLDFYNEKVFNDLGPVGLDTIKYPLPTVYGRADYLESLQNFLNYQWNVSVSSDDIFAASGVVAALELLALALFKPGDEVLIPAPLWYGFHWSFSQTAGLKFVSFPIDDGVTLTRANVQNALDKYQNAKLLVLTNPNNPLGTNYSRQQQEEIYSLFLENPDRHIISDEIYACSQIKDKSEFVSALSLDAYQKYSDRIHVTWGLSKDFGLAGFRAGFIITKSNTVQTALKDAECAASLCWFSPFVTPNYYLTKKLFLDNSGAPDPRLANDAMVLYKSLLVKQYSETAQHLEKGNIRYYPGNHGAMFFWIDLRPYLDRVPESVSDQPVLCPEIYKYDDARERRLANYVSGLGVLLTRGQECFNEEPGFFRLCFTAEVLDRVTLGIDNMVRGLEVLPPSS
ncbi:MAG TPA: pyridoxal phosphate-dependent aminotransferase [Pyrinomonadaceae bacterium]|jgi:aspartate/methionine/tyrosine aminotransferase